MLNTGEDAEQQLSYTAGRGANNVTDTLEIVWQFLKRLNLELPYNPLVPLVGIYQREMKTCLHKELYVILIIGNNPDVLYLVNG